MMKRWGRESDYSENLKLKYSPASQLMSIISGVFVGLALAQTVAAC